MPEILKLALLGSPHVLRDQQPLTAFATAKAQALLFYLAVTAQAAPHSRDALAALLWGEMGDAQARQNLRTVLHDLRSLVGDHLQIERQTVAFNRASSYWLDVGCCGAASPPLPAPVDLAAHQAAVDLYQGEFLSGFYVRQAPAFEAWVLDQREQLHMLVVETLFDLVREYMQRDAYASALAANRRLLFLEPWSEPAHRQQMLILEQTSERSAALAQYEACRRILLAEFDVEPLPETIALYEHIRAGSSAQRARGSGMPRLRPSGTQAGAAGTTGEAGKRGVPAQTVGDSLPRQIELYGRQAELERLHTWAVRRRLPPDRHLRHRRPGEDRAGRRVCPRAGRRRPDRTSADTGEAGFTCVLWRSLLNAPPLADAAGVARCALRSGGDNPTRSASISSSVNCWTFAAPALPVDPRQPGEHPAER